MKAARMHEYHKPLVLEDIPVPDIQPNEILVKVAACGMCGSDVQLVDEYFKQYADIPLPMTLGHEIVGVVHKIGDTVPQSAGFNEGDQVVVVPGWGDGTCASRQRQLFISPKIDEWKSLEDHGITAVIDLDGCLDLGIPNIPNHMLYVCPILYSATERVRVGTRRVSMKIHRRRPCHAVKQHLSIGGKPT